MSNTILAIETAVDCCSVAIYKNNNIYSSSERCQYQHTVQILPMIQKMLFHAEIKLTELNYIAFSKGPGSFTGIRIAASIAQSLSLSLKIPIITVSTLAIMAEKAWRKYQKKKIMILMYANIKYFYWAQYILNKKLVWRGEKTESLINQETIKDKINNSQKNWTFVGNGWKKFHYEKFIDIKKIIIFSPNAKDIIPFVLLKIRDNHSLKSIQNNINYLYNKF